MALTLPWLVAAVVAAIGEVVWTPRPPLAEPLVSRVANETAASLAARRGVRITRPLTTRLVDRAQMTAARNGFGRRDDPSAASVQRERDLLYRHLGLDPRPATESGGAPAEITGLYDLPHDRLLVASWADLASGRFALTRDIAHALLDRRFDLGRWLAPAAPGAARDPGPDALLAREALLYGDATTQALEQLADEGDLPSPRALASVAENVRRTLLAEAGATAPSFALQRRLFLELDGLKFVVALRSRLPWSSVDEVWRRPPQSTEQILHPRKYEAGELPDDVAARLPAQPHSRWRVVHGDTLGELGTRLFLEQGTDAYRAERAATGWGGDRALLFQTSEADQDPTGRSTAAVITRSPTIAGAAAPRTAGGLTAAALTFALFPPSTRPAPAGDPAAPASLGPPTSATTFVAWITTWDDETEADDFAAEAARALALLAQVPLLDARPASGRLRFTDGAGRLFALDRSRRTVGLLLAAPTDAESLLAGLMRAGSQSSSPRRSPPRPAAVRDQARGRPR